MAEGRSETIALAPIDCLLHGKVRHIMSDGNQMDVSRIEINVFESQKGRFYLAGVKVSKFLL